jgi:NAD(P)-dependent dehydrogenase (short-subunit alcohol dehydrogenase family)
MTSRLRQKIAVVMGGGSAGPGWGTGKATAVLFAREGATVVVIDKVKAAAEETAEIIRLEGGKALPLTCDATREDAVKATVAETVKQYGRIDILDNNVGITEAGGVLDLDEGDWDTILSLNLRAAVLTMKHVIPVMLKNGGGAIVNISSIAAIRYTGIPLGAYAAAKAALSQLSRSTAVEFAGRKVRCNAILPGLLRTPMVEQSASIAKAYGGTPEEMWKKRDAQVPLGHMGDAWDIAYAALYLASDEAKYVTGIDLTVDGGISARIA